jgi:hypothetical protein
MSGFHYGTDMMYEARRHALEYLEVVEWRDVEAVCSNAFTREGDQPFHFLISVQQPNGKVLSACVDRYEDGRWHASLQPS